MSQGGYVTLVGYVAREPNIRNTKNGTPVCDMRVGTTPSFYDKAAGAWRDGETTYYTVECWRRLAGHVKASLRKGDPVLVKGRFRADSYTDRAGVVKTEVRITADTVGHDLSRGIANYMRPERPAAKAETDPAAEGPDRGRDEADVSLDSDIIDEGAIEQLERDLGESLDDAEDEAADVAVPTAPF